MRARVGTTRTRDAGFTLLELLVALSIMALLMLTLPQLSPGARENRAVRATVYALAGALRQARAEALAGNTAVDVEINLKARTYRAGATRTPLPPQLGIAVTGGLPSDDDIVGVRFFPDGSATPGRIVITGARGGSHHVAVAMLSGRIAVDE